VLVSGRVQGVGFRLACVNEAVRLGLAGYVRNLEDGRVEVVVRGEPDQVAALLAWCRVGPPAASVGEVTETGVSSDLGDQDGLPRPFRMRSTTRGERL
jgi:acylphosphatase